MKDVLLYLIQHIAEKPDELKIEEEESDSYVMFYITCAKEDIGRIIGKNGKVIKALRRVLSILALKQDKRITLTMVSKD